METAPAQVQDSEKERYAGYLGQETIELCKGERRATDAGLDTSNQGQGRNGQLLLVEGEAGTHNGRNKANEERPNACVQGRGRGRGLEVGC